MYLQGCGELIRETMLELAWVGMCLHFLYSTSFLFGWMTVYSMARNAGNELGTRNDWKVKTHYNLAEGYLTHLQNIYMDIAEIPGIGSGEPAREMSLNPDAPDP
jgi:hypothetical protein